MDNQTPYIKRFYKDWKFWAVFFGLGLVMTIIDPPSSQVSDTATQPQSVVEQKAEPKKEEPKQEEKKDFNQLAKERFAEILKASPELESIQCEKDNCNLSTVYFDYKQLPEDLESAIRSNTATYSVFKGNNGSFATGVIIFARYQGKEIMYCTARKGVVEECSR